MVEKEIVKR